MPIKTLKKAFENYKFYNPKSPLLLGKLQEDDIIQQGNQKSMLVRFPDLNALTSVMNTV